MNVLNSIILKHVNYLPLTLMRKCFKRDKRAAVIDYVLEENKRKTSPSVNRPLSI